ncbi:hypothetical protein [Flavobacterium sp. K5-23]|uniref:hypothetical protein n=1 Tax=Flavobacterium sp. K5-23 TaxID=2746225 RepID=UPI00200C0516|nr:hypothetical protein [Flavobacterium sp. K5-23]UQD57416.1 hypothetical protein FLAK523_13820 [Flavobacterium sp. K5-23]
MPHLLAKLSNVPIDFIAEILEKDKEYHASQGMYLENIWQNADNENEVFFMFKIDSIEKTKMLIDKLHTEALIENPEENLPTMLYLE